MGAFSTLAAAEIRARELMEQGHATVAHAQHDKSGTIGVRVLRPMSATGSTGDGMNAPGAWDIITDDAAT